MYRTDYYRRLKATVEKQSKRRKCIGLQFGMVCLRKFYTWLCLPVNIVERKKEMIGEAKLNPAKKKLEKQEEQLKTNSRDLSMVKMKSMVAIGVTFTAILGMFNSM